MEYNQRQAGQSIQPAQSFYRVLAIDLAARMVTVEWMDPSGAVQRLQAPLDPLAAVRVASRPADLAAIRPGEARATIRIDQHGRAMTMTVTSIEQ
jgi:hypothetical protein